MIRIASILLLVGSLAMVGAEQAPPIGLSPAPPNQFVTSPHTNVPVESAPLFPTPAYFKKAFEPAPIKVELKPPVRLSDYTVDNKLELSLRSYLDLVLSNNTDIAISKLTIETPRNAILRGYSIFDPLLFGQFTTTRQLQPANDALAGAAAVNTLAQPTTFRYSQLLPTGTNYNVGFNTNKFSTNSSFATYNPALNAGMNLSFSQPLLRNRGGFVTKLPITIARSRLRAAEFNFEDNVFRLVAQAENAYWDVISARENLRVQEQALALADASLKRAQRELELGAISALEIYQPQQNYANAEITVTQSRYRLAQVEDALRRQIGADLDPQIRNLPIVLTENITPPAEAQLDKEALVDKAKRLRPDVRAQIQSLDVDDLQIKSASNQLRPQLNLTAQYGGSGRGGLFNQRTNVFDPEGGRSTIVSTVPGGFGDALSQLFAFDFPVYGFGLTLNLPLRDRRAAADYADAVVAKRLDTLRLRNIEQSTRLEVLNAINQVENSRASVELARVALDFAQKRADAEQKRYDLGTITLFFLLAAQTDLTQAQSNLVNQSVQYRRSLITLLRTTGELLDERGIKVQ